MLNGTSCFDDEPLEQHCLASGSAVFTSYMCRCCGKPASSRRHHLAVRALRLSADERGCLIGRCGLTIQELTRRCRVCILVECNQVLISGPSADLVDHAVVMIQGRVMRALRERNVINKHDTSLLRRCWYLDPEAILASRPSGHWRLEGGRIQSTQERCTSSIFSSVGEHSDACDVSSATPRKRFTLATISWRGITRR
jgi:hypothetical protein